MKRSRAIILVLAAEAFVIVLGIFNYDWTLEGLQAATRFSGRLSLFLFTLIFLLHPSKKVMLSGLLSTDYFLMFAIAHGIHLIELLSFVLLSGVELVPYRVAGGFLAYLFIFLMPYLQVRFNQGKIEPARFNLIGYIFLFYTWFIFFMTYFGRLKNGFSGSGGTHEEFVILMIYVCVLLVVKLSGFLFSKK